MDSQTKKRLSDLELEMAVKAAYGQESHIISVKELTDGWFNTAYLISINDGDEVVLKLSPSADTNTMRYEKNIMQAEVEVLQLLAETKKVPVPKVHYYDASKSFIDCEYFFMEKLEGQPYNQIKDTLTSAEKAAIETELGRYNRLINEIEGEFFGYYAQKDRQGAKWSEVFHLMISGVLTDGKEIGLTLPMGYERVEKEIMNKLHVLDEVVKPRLVHWDLWDGNVFVKEGGIVGLIDCERALWADPLMEFYFSHFTQSAAFKQGYGESASIENSCERRKLYDLFLDLVLYIECPFRKYDNKEHIQWTLDNLTQGWERFLKE